MRKKYWFYKIPNYFYLDIHRSSVLLRKFDNIFLTMTGNTALMVSNICLGEKIVMRFPEYRISIFTLCKISYVEKDVYNNWEDKIFAHFPVHCIGNTYRIMVPAGYEKGMYKILKKIEREDHE